MLTKMEEKGNLLKKIAWGHGFFGLIYEWERQRDLEEYTRAEKFRVMLGALKVLWEESVIASLEKSLSLHLAGDGRA